MLLHRIWAIVICSLVLSVPPLASAADTPSAAMDAAAEAAAETAAAPGCTAPTQDGCATCCRPLDNGMCTQLSWTGGPDSKVTPWYNAQKALGTACPPDCRKCADCLDRDRTTLAKLKRPEDCACEGREFGPDPCHAPLSCECYCSRYERLAAKCVDAGPGPTIEGEGDDAGGW